MKGNIYHNFEIEPFSSEVLIQVTEEYLQSFEYTNEELFHSISDNNAADDLKF